MAAKRHATTLETKETIAPHALSQRGMETEIEAIDRDRQRGATEIELMAERPAVAQEREIPGETDRGTTQDTREDMIAETTAEMIEAETWIMTAETTQEDLEMTAVDIKEQEKRMRLELEAEVLSARNHHNGQ